MKSPLLRFYLALVLTVLLLMFSVGQLFRWLNDEQNPMVDARRVLDAVQQLSYNQQPIRCSLQNNNSCDQSLFVEYPKGLWTGNKAPDKDQVFTLKDSNDNVLLCSVEPQGELLCINQLNWPDKSKFTLDLAYLFYFGLFLTLFIFSRRLFRDVEVLRHSALQEIRFGKFPAFKLSSRSYLQPLAQSLGNLTRRIEQLNRFQAEMAETVCHDIKTPLARLKFITHMLNGERLNDSKAQITRNLDEIEENIYDYLRLAQNEYTVQPLNMESINLHHYIMELVQPFLIDNDKEIHCEIPDDIEVSVDSKLLMRAINNLLINAVRFSKQQIWLSACVYDNWLQLSIEDDGPGWQQATPNQTSQDAIPSHHNIGLAIVRRVTEQHQGYLELSRGSQGGALAVLNLPMPTREAPMINDKNPNP